MCVVKRLILLFLSVILVACGGEKNSDDLSFIDVRPEIIAPQASENYSQLLLLDDNSIISLVNDVSDPQGLPLSLISVKSDDEDCVISDFDKQNLSFSVEKKSPSLCTYHYTVRNNPSNLEEAKTVSSNSYVFVSKTRTASTLSPISKVSTINSSVFIDLKAELGAEAFPDSFQLDSTQLVMGEGAISDTDIVNGTISFQTGDAKGITRIVYSLASVDTDDVKVGYIDIAVSLDSNGMPVAESFIGPENVPLNTMITIDVAEHISDPDSHPLQLMEAYSINSDVSATDPDSLTNTSFNFQADEPGRYDVSYYISDHHNGYAIGTVRINVMGPILPWSDITLTDGEVYTAPWEQNGADGYHIPYQNIEPEFIDGTEYQIALFNYSTADTLCRVRGMLLPTVEQLNKLYGEVEDISADENWPVVRDYWTINKSGYDLMSGEQITLSDTDLAIVTCVKPATLAATVVTDSAFTTDVADSGEGYFDEIEASVKDLKGEGVEGEEIYAYSSSPSLSITPSNVTTDTEGKAKLVVRSSESGVFTVSVRYLSQAVDTVVSFVQNYLESFYITPSESSLDVGQMVSLNSYGDYLSGISKILTNESTWTVTKGPGVISIDDAGLVHALDSGEAEVTANYVEYDSNDVEIARWSDKATVTVFAAGPQSLIVNPASVDLVVGDTQIYSATAYYANGTNKPVDATYTSNFPSTASVEGNVVTGVRKGGATITATYNEDGVEVNATSEVTVSKGCSYIKLSPSPINLAVGDTQKVSVEAYYTDGSHEPIYNYLNFGSTDSTVASVNLDGVVRGMAPGDAVIFSSFMYLGKKCSGEVDAIVN